MAVFRSKSLPAALIVLWSAAFAVFCLPAAAGAAERSRIVTFLEITGFDIALESIALSAGDAPAMLGLEAGDFGSDWTRLSAQVFETAKIRDLALDILEETLDDAALDHAETFYDSDLGRRLVAAENAAHMIADGSVKQGAGQRIIADLVQQGSDRPALFQQMSQAIDPDDAGLKAVQQIQFRFLMAASAAGVIDLSLDAEGLRAWQAQQAPGMRMALRASAIASSAYTYQEFSDDEIRAYVRALETPLMQQVYELFHAVQYEITANRFEALATRMRDLRRGEDI